MKKTSTIGLSVLCRPFTEERLAVEVPKHHPLAVHESISFTDLTPYPVLVLREPTVWWDILQSHGIHMIFQDDPAVLNDLKQSSNLIGMNSDLARRWIEPSHDRVIISISDPSAAALFYACTTEKNAGLLDPLIPLQF